MEKEELLEKDVTEQNDGKKSSKKKKAARPKDETKKLKEEIFSLQEQLLRKAAEFENYKKRTEREFARIIQNAGENIITSLLPVLDDLDRSLEHARKSEDVESLREGMELISKKLYAVLEKEGLKPLDAVGKEFDPEKHDALLQVEKDGVESGTVVEEHLKGYELNNKVIRHAQVIVAR